MTKKVLTEQYLHVETITEDVLLNLSKRSEWHTRQSVEGETFLKSSLHFNLDDPEDRKACLRALKSTDAYLVISVMFDELRQVWKYGQDEIDAKYAEKWRDTLYELCKDYAIDLDAELR